MAAKIFSPSRRKDIFEENGELTHRFILWMESVTDQTNTTTTIVSEIAPATFFSSQLQQLRRELNGLPQFTMDTEGFTMDTTNFTMDKVIA